MVRSHFLSWPFPFLTLPHVLSHVGDFENLLQNWALPLRENEPGAFQADQLCWGPQGSRAWGGHQCGKGKPKQCITRHRSICCESLLCPPFPSFIFILVPRVFLLQTFLRALLPVLGAGQGSWRGDFCARSFKAWWRCDLSSSPHKDHPGLWKAPDWLQAPDHDFWGFLLWVFISAFLIFFFFSFLNPFLVLRTNRVFALGRRQEEPHEHWLLVPLPWLGWWWVFFSPLSWCLRGSFSYLAVFLWWWLVWSPSTSLNTFISTSTPLCWSWRLIQLHFLTSFAKRKRDCVCCLILRWFLLI